MSNSNDKVIWQDNFEIGLEEVDDQHHMLVDTINKANNLLVKDYTFKDLEDITNDLIHYALLHFETEEDLMHTYAYDTKKPKDYDIHTSEHHKFKARVTAIREDIKKGEFVEREEIINFLCQWLVDHTNKIDKKLGKFLEQVDK
ncbi:MAG: bacteriohemerythrin [Campylobacterota bacterium]|nr:bacteriohemerythrin [Campylobacterota bacterium]